MQLSSFVNTVNKLRRSCSEELQSCNLVSVGVYIYFLIYIPLNDGGGGVGEKEKEQKELR